MEWPAYLDEYQKLVIRMNTPRVVIDNAVCATATLVKVDSASREHGVLLEAVQVLNDLDLTVRKAYMSSDGRWFMDVFHVTDQFGHKLNDESVISYLEQSLDAGNPETNRDRGCEGLTALELTGPDRPGLLSEVFAVLAELECDVAGATVWTHRGRIACLIFVKDELTGAPIADAHRTRRIESRLRQVLNADGASCSAAVATAFFSHVDRRLHQLMLADLDYDHTSPASTPSAVSVQNWAERGYSIVNVQCRDRPKLLFDMVCTLTDMDFVVCHGTVDTAGDQTQQEFYIKHRDGSTIRSEAEKQRVIQCLQAAIERRASESTRLELCIKDRPRLLSEVTRTFRENGLLVIRAEVSTKGDMAADVFYVTGAAGQPADQRAIEAVRERIGSEWLRVKEEQCPRFRHKEESSSSSKRGDDAMGAGVGLFNLGSFVMRNLHNLGLIKS
ncbi:ACT domain-containing protein ACR8-like [Zingiber officinale]|nr:ACT domain-containing protein ACR8-like [Zingiber officinale]